MSYIINNMQELVAVTTETYKSGEEIRYAYSVGEEAINADREHNLINSHWGKISNAKKWAHWGGREHCIDSAQAINGSDDEFLIL